MKNMVFRKNQSGSTIINIPKQFTEFANAVSTISCLYLPINILQEDADHISECTPYRTPFECTKLSGPTGPTEFHRTGFFFWVMTRNSISSNGTVWLVVTEKMKLMTTHAGIIWMSIIGVTAVPSLPEMVSRWVLLHLSKYLFFIF